MISNMHQHTCFIYLLFDSEGKPNYVGRTQCVTRRMQEHKQDLGFRPTFKIIDSCNTNCRSIEKKWIDHYREQNYELRNIHYGQGPHFLSEAVQKALSIKLTGRPVTWGAKISAAQKGIPRNFSDEGKLQLRLKGSINSRKFWEGKTKAERKQFVLSSSVAAWNKKSEEERKAWSQKSTENNKKTWLGRTPEQRKEIAHKISEGHARRRALNPA